MDVGGDKDMRDGGVALKAAVRYLATNVDGLSLSARVQSELATRLDLSPSQRHALHVLLQWARRWEAETIDIMMTWHTWQALNTPGKS